jgi:hypothetical protein
MFFVGIVLAVAVGLIVLLRPWPFYLKSEESPAAERNVAVEFGKWVEKRALVRGLNVRGVARAVPLECPKCKKESNYFVYPDELCERCWRATLKPTSTPTKHLP